MHCESGKSLNFVLRNPSSRPENFSKGETLSRIRSKILLLPVSLERQFVYSWISRLPILWLIHCELIGAPLALLAGEFTAFPTG